MRMRVDNEQKRGQVSVYECVHIFIGEFGTTVAKEAIIAAATYRETTRCEMCASSKRSYTRVFHHTDTRVPLAP